MNTPDVVSKLVNENFGLARYWAGKFEWRYGYNDALSYAMEGLLRAAERYVPERGIKFGTWASVSIKYRFNNAGKLTMTQMRGGAGLHGRGEKKHWISLDAPCGEGSTMTVEQFIADTSAARPGERMAANEEFARTREEVNRLLSLLTDRDRRIMEMRFGFDGETMTLEEIAKVFRLTRERVRQIEHASLRKFWRDKRRKKLEPVTAADLQQVA